jgi:hypothetical protein
MQGQRSQLRNRVRKHIASIMSCDPAAVATSDARAKNFMPIIGWSEFEEKWEKYCPVLYPVGGNSGRTSSNKRALFLAPELKLVRDTCSCIFLIVSPPSLTGVCVGGLW